MVGLALHVACHVRMDSLVPNANRSVCVRTMADAIMSLGSAHVYQVTSESIVKNNVNDQVMDSFNIPFWLCHILNLTVLIVFRTNTPIHQKKTQNQMAGVLI